MLRLQVFCEDRLGLTYDLLSILTKQNLSLRGIEIDAAGRIFLSFPTISFVEFSQLMSMIRKLEGVKDVKRVDEKSQQTEQDLLLKIINACTEPVLFLNPKGQSQYKNSAFDELMITHGLAHQSPLELKEQLDTICKPEFDVSHWLTKLASPPSTQVVAAKPSGEPLVLQRYINGYPYLLHLTPLYTGRTTSLDDTFSPAPLSELSKESLHQEDTESLFLGLVITFKQHIMPKAKQVMTLPLQADPFAPFSSQSSSFQELIKQAKKYALLDAPLLIQGETGTGKEMLARACHLSSSRAHYPFQVVNCVSMPDDAAETELFGWIAKGKEEGGKGQFEQACGGTVFLDGVEEMSPHLQIKLLRFLQDGTFRRVGEEHPRRVNVRVICASQRHLFDLVSEGTFRDDLFYRLSVLSLTLPPLRKRVKDIPLLCLSLMHELSKELDKPLYQLTPAAREKLNRYQWPGNVRQLRNLLFDAIIRTETGFIDAADLIFPDIDISPALSENELEGTLDEMMYRHEAKILQALYTAYPSSRKLAKRLNLSHTAVANKLRQYEIAKIKKKES